MPKIGWKRSLESLGKIFKESKECYQYRFNLPYIKISDIAEQYYCEAKVHNEYEFGRISTKIKEEGKRIHEELFEMKKTSIRKLIKLIEEEFLCCCTFPVFAKIGKMVIVGIPDAIVFRDSKPILLVELKTATIRVDRLWKDEKIQVMIYAFALDHMKFDCSELTPIVVKTKRGAPLKKSVLDALIKSRVENNFDDLNAIEEKEGLKVYRVFYSKERVIRDLYQVEDYWLMKRGPIPTTNINKCKACIYVENCPFSPLKLSKR